MKFCPYCGADLIGTERVCPICGGNLMIEENENYSEGTEFLEHSPYEPDQYAEPQNREVYAVPSRNGVTYGNYDDGYEYEDDSKKSSWVTIVIVLCSLVFIMGTVIALIATGVIDFSGDNSEKTTLKKKKNTDSDSESESSSKKSSSASSRTSSNSDSDSDNSGSVSSGSYSEVPQLLGLSADEAKKQLESLGCDVETEYITDTDTDTDIDEDLVIAQEPDYGDLIPSGSTVTLYVLKAGKYKDSDEVSSAAKVKVPNITKKSYDDAEAELEKSSLLIEISEYQFSETVEAGKIISQSPSSGTVEENSVVMVVVSKGPDPANYVDVDSYIGNNIHTVKEILEDAGLTVKYSYEYDNTGTYAYDVIMSQDAENGTSLKKGSTITFVVSKGKNVGSSTSGKNDTDQEPELTLNLPDPPASKDSNHYFSGVNASSSKSDKFSPNNALQGDTSCWSEGASGDGVGEYFILTANGDRNISGVEIINGYIKNEQTFYDYGRITDIRIELSDGTSIETTLDPNSMGLQTITFDKAVMTSYIKIIITGAEAGDRYHDTCITLVRPF